jgi:hypothetical protein
MSNSSESVCGKTGKRKRFACWQDNDEMQFEPDRELRKEFRIAYVNSISRSSSVANCPPHRLVAGVQNIEISDGRGHKLERAGHADDEYGRVDEGEQVHSSVDNSSDGDSVKCPVCSVTFTAQEVGTPDTHDQTFCTACLQK